MGLALGRPSRCLQAAAVHDALVARTMFLEGHYLRTKRVPVLPQQTRVGHEFYTAGVRCPHKCAHTFDVCGSGPKQREAAHDRSAYVAPQDAPQQ